MEIDINKLHKIFNPDFVSEHDSEVTINEKDKKASVRDFFFTNAKFLSFNNELIDKNNELFKKKG